MLNRRNLAKTLAAGLGAAGLAAVLGAAPAQAQPYPPGYGAPPPSPYEAVPRAPGPGYVWRPGHWRWTGHRYVWVRGVYLARDPHWHHWVDGHWVPRAGTWVWVPAHWG